MRIRSILAVLGGVAILFLVVGWLDQPAAPTPRLPPLSVTVDNARTFLRAGESVTYRTTVRNDDSRPHPLTVTQMLPAALDVTGASSGGDVDSKQVRWQVDVPAGGSLVLSAVGRVGESHNGYAQVTTTSCVDLPGHPSASCASDTDPLSAPASPSGARFFLLAGLGVAIVAAGLAFSHFSQHSEGAGGRPAPQAGEVAARARRRLRRTRPALGRLLSALVASLRDHFPRVEPVRLATQGLGHRRQARSPPSDVPDEQPER